MTMASARVVHRLIEVLEEPHRELGYAIGDEIGAVGASAVVGVVGVPARFPATSSHAIDPMIPRPTAVIALMVGRRASAGILSRARSATEHTTATIVSRPVQNLREASSSDHAFFMRRLYRCAWEDARWSGRSLVATIAV